MLIQMNRNLYHDSLSVVECSGTSWSAGMANGMAKWVQGVDVLQFPMQAEVAEKAGIRYNIGL